MSHSVVAPELERPRSEAVFVRSVSTGIGKTDSSLRRFFFSGSKSPIISAPSGR